MQVGDLPDITAASYQPCAATAVSVKLRDRRISVEHGTKTIAPANGSADLVLDGCRLKSRNDLGRFVKGQAK